MISTVTDDQRIVITGVGLTAPNGNNLAEYRAALLERKSGVRDYEIRYVGKTLAGVCEFDELRYQKRRNVRRGTRAGSIAIYSAQEAIRDAGIEWEKVDRSRIGVYIGVTEHGNVETENEIYEIKGFDYDTKHLVTPPQSPHGGQQPGRRDHLEHGDHRTALHRRCGLCRGQCRTSFRPPRCCCSVNATWPSPAESRRAFTRSASSPGSPVRVPWPNMTIPPKHLGPSIVNRNGIVVSPKEGVCLHRRTILPTQPPAGAKIYGELVGHTP